MGVGAAAVADTAGAGADDGAAVGANVDDGVDAVADGHADGAADTLANFFIVAALVCSGNSSPLSSEETATGGILCLYGVFCLGTGIERVSCLALSTTSVFQRRKWAVFVELIFSFWGYAL